MHSSKGVGKTTLVKKLQDSKYDCNSNISTNGVNIATLELSRKSSSLFSKLGKKDKEKEPGIKFNVWDFGGQAVFHSTHRLFITSNAIYVILYDMARPDTIERIKYAPTSPSPSSLDSKGIGLSKLDQ
jgi:internalin A